MTESGFHPQQLVFPKMTDGRGNLTFVQNNDQIPFDIKRVYYLYDVPDEQTRAGHALKATHQVMIAISGRFDAHLDDGMGNTLSVTLDSPDRGLYVPPMIWRLLTDFSVGAVCLCLVSTPYDSGDYYRDFDSFRAAVQG